MDARGQLVELRLVLEDLYRRQPLTVSPAALPGILRTRSTVVIGGIHRRLVNMDGVPRHTLCLDEVHGDTYKIGHAITDRQLNVFLSYARVGVVHEGRIDAALDHGRGHSLHHVALPQMDMKVRRGGQLQPLGRLDLHFWFPGRRRVFSSDRTFWALTENAPRRGAKIQIGYSVHYHVIRGATVASTL